jgi:predicted MFS family arabinose efflux permease
LWLAFRALGTLLALTSARILNPERSRVVGKTPGSQVLPRVFWLYVTAVGLLACGMVNFPLLAYRFQGTGVAAEVEIPLLYAGAMGVNGLTALIFGRLYHRFGLATLTFGILISLLTLPLGFLGGPETALASVICWATGLGAQDACLRSGIATVVSMNKRWTAFGTFNGVFGVAWFLGSLAMGLLYSHSLAALVAFGMAAQFAAAMMFLALRRRVHAQA